MPGPDSVDLVVPAAGRQPRDLRRHRVPGQRPALPARFGCHCRQRVETPRARPKLQWVLPSTGRQAPCFVCGGRIPRGRPGVVSIQPGSFNDQQPAYPRIWQS
ncbi:hypothetical protein EN794_021390 [Mesorhizobium sp. M00.F.Ca.ET.151.01.1.1]|nr:hypothetical protein EN842_17935 [bacterium M00.F.Ca.ET.199.01.1.1]TGT06303.1 hypothetical protein EN820_09650 [bacterium M00.F.Ca.ET.177.01.1.1]TGT61926.1 hypothetical protein EN813_016625 [Mesorhizobium sp. M00.F.Ca.ET.170.01.1.1]TGU13529.1 hypothetical protein EN806_13120 [bacterium M00.F.Ca.ET.163.01.1.1]TGU95489.1 hypothetical protein EN794_021390 [Mesorhizobium sp. M00.F.Ca.ET.151.01.1.1]TGV57243.1 hypothetical protein EN784_22190 [bacterium M00.F.Ca.ET.141.01.1.1]